MANSITVNQIWNTIHWADSVPPVTGVGNVGSTVAIALDGTEVYRTVRDYVGEWEIASIINDAMVARRMGMARVALRTMKSADSDEVLSFVAFHAVARNVDTVQDCADFINSQFLLLPGRRRLPLKAHTIASFVMAPKTAAHIVCTLLSRNEAGEISTRTVYETYVGNHQDRIEDVDLYKTVNVAINWDRLPAGHNPVALIAEADGRRATWWYANDANHSFTFANAFGAEECLFLPASVKRTVSSKMSEASVNGKLAGYDQENEEKLTANFGGIYPEEAWLAMQVALAPSALWTPVHNDGTVRGSEREIFVTSFEGTDNEDPDALQSPKMEFRTTGRKPVFNFQDGGRIHTEAYSEEYD